jgi:RimJ/RimL family protein N-acetyltransferase
MIVFGDAVAQWVCERTQNDYFPGAFRGIGILKNEEIVCGVAFDGYNGSSIQIHVALKEGHQMTREWLRAVFDYPFKQLGVKKIIGIVDSGNPQALRFDKHIGFIEEAVIKDAARLGDLHILSMTPQQCRFLRKKT